MKAFPAPLITTLLSAVLCGACLLPQAAFCQGNLTPPGAPAPTMKTLAQVEPMGNNPFAVAVADVNGDGQPDLRKETL